MQNLPENVIGWTDPDENSVFAVFNGVEKQVPRADKNPHWQAIERWVAEGNTIPAYVPPPPPPVTEVHAAWIKAYLSEQGWREELETIITNSGPIAQALWESGTTFNVSDKLVNDLWALHSQSANHSVQDVFDAANALRKSQTEG